MAEENIAESKETLSLYSSHPFFQFNGGGLIEFLGEMGRRGQGTWSNLGVRQTRQRKNSLFRSRSYRYVEDVGQRLR